MSLAVPGERTNDILQIERQEQLDAFCAQARAQRSFAFDTEFVMEDRYESEVCLIQLATEESVALVDPFLELNLQPLWDLICDESIETIVHAGQEDLAACVRLSGKTPRRVFDVQIAAGLVGMDYPLSLQKLVQALLHIRLHKSKTLTDWRRRPLNAPQLRYAAEDVSHLPAAARKLHERLARKDRLAWAEEEFRSFEDPALYTRVEEDKLRRVKGVSGLKGQSLTVARRLFQWRDEIARSLNRPARIILKDHLMVEIARHGITEYTGLRELRGLNLSDRNVHALAGVVREALTLPPEDWPTSREHDVEAPRESVLIALTTAVARGYCIGEELAYGLVATKKAIRDLIRHRTIGQPEDPAQVELLSGWRGRTIGRILDDVLAGRRTLRVEPDDGAWTVRVSPAARA